jgi:hypothetical protein
LNNFIVDCLIAGWHALVWPIVFVFRGRRRTLVTLWAFWRRLTLAWCIWGVSFVLRWRGGIFPS